MKYLSQDGKKMVNALIAKGIPKMGLTPVFLVDEKYNVLNTEPICVVCEKYHPWFIDWLNKKFKEELDEVHSKETK